MFGGDIERNTNSREKSTESTIEFHFRINLLLVLALCVLRILALNIWVLINDLLLALMIYLTYKQQGKLMALFCFISGMIGFIFSLVTVVKAAPSLSKNIYVIVIFSIVVYASIVYTYLSVVSFFAFRTYTAGCPCPMGNSNANSQPSYNYGSVPTEEPKFNAFSGKAYTIA